MDNLKVISNLHRPDGTPWTIKGRYDGKDYVFRTGVPVIMSREAAGHIFGLDAEDIQGKAAALNQLGILKPGDDFETQLALLDQFTFLEGRVQFDDEPTPAVAPIRGRKTGGRRPHVDPAGEAGEGEPSPADSETEEPATAGGSAPEA